MEHLFCFCRIGRLCRWWMLSNMDMVLAKSDTAIASRYAELVSDSALREAIFGRLRAEWGESVRALLAITEQKTLLEHPRLSPRAVIGPGARFLDFLFTGGPTPTTQPRRRRWSCCIDDVAVLMFTKRRWRRRNFIKMSGGATAVAGILCFKPALGLEDRGTQIQEEYDQRGH
jgi:hypothetical protein